MRRLAGLLLAALLLAAAAGASQRERLRELVRARLGKRARTETLAGVRVSIWEPAARGKAPLAVFSHGFHGNSLQSTFLTEALAREGYLVVAPEHRDAGEERLGKPDLWTEETHRHRAEDVRKVLEGLRAHPGFDIDWNKLALVGHSLGGYTVLGLAGAWPSWKLPGVAAVVALSPYASPFTRKGTLGALGVPVLYQGGTRDLGITPFVAKKGGAFDQTGSPAFLVIFDGAGHFAWTDLNGRYHEPILKSVLAFLRGATEPARGLLGVAVSRAK